MENEEQKPKKRRAPQDAPVGIRLSQREREALRTIAQSQGKPVSTLIRECCLAYLDNAGEHEKLMTALAPQNPKEVQKTLFDILTKNNDGVINELEQLRNDIKTNQEEIIDLLKRVVFLDFYMGREYSKEEHYNRAIQANSKRKKFLETPLGDYQVQGAKS